jgi:hypothetical protein
MKGSTIPELIINPARGWLSSHCSCDSTQTLMQLDLEKPQRWTDKTTTAFLKEPTVPDVSRLDYPETVATFGSPKYLTIC